jgi:hypothetical protein
MLITGPLLQMTSQSDNANHWLEINFQSELQVVPASKSPLPRILVLKLFFAV